VDGHRPNWKRLWLTPVAVLTALALAVFAGFYLLDHFVTGGGPAVSVDNALQRYVQFDPDKLTDAVASLAGIIAAVLGIVITVVSIVVQLSADRYTGVAHMFLRDRINVGVMAYFVVACVCGVWLSVSLHSDFVPRAALLAMMGATTIGLVLMLPYFAYVFWFLEPGNIIARISRDAARSAKGGAQDSTLTAMEELTDITSNSISGKDKIIASRAIDALKDFTLSYFEMKPGMDATWFRIGAGIGANPDFVAMDRESLRDLEARRTWVEWKVLRQYLGIYNEALSAMPDVNYLIAIDTRYIGEAAAGKSDDEVVRTVLRFMNSYMRATLNARNVRTAYNVLNQYRLLLESLVRQRQGAFALEGVTHMNYYGHVSYDMNLTFVTETVAYDISALCQYAHEQGSPEQDEMLDQFLLLDQPTSVKAQEQGLLGVRKAQVKLAAYYLKAGEQAKARRIADDMKDEPPERLQAIKAELERVESKDFWEIIDRGRNFEFMPPDQRAQMAAFFAWLNIVDAPDG
jgi:hypothetical protein